MILYPSETQQQQLASMNPSRPRKATLNTFALAAALPDHNYSQSQSQAQSQAYAQLSAQQQQHYQIPPAAALAYQLQQQQQQSAPTPLRTQQQRNQQYAPQFAQQFQGMYVPAPGAHMQTLPSAMGMPQQGYAGVFAPQQQQVQPFFYHQQAPLFAGQTAMFRGQFAPQHGGGSGQSSRRPSEQFSVCGSDVGRGSSAGSSSSIGPPRKPAQLGHALWVGNPPPAVSVLDLKDHFAQGAREELLSVFLMAKSSCAFVNYTTEEACASAVERFHYSRLGRMRVVCSLRRSAVGVVGGVPTGPAALSGGKIEGGRVKGEKKVDGEEGGKSATTPEEETPAKDKYFIVKSLTVEDLEMSVRKGVWATQSHNEAALDKAYKTAEKVYLIFSANKSGEHYGYALMTSPIHQDPAAAIAFAPASTTSTNKASATTLDFASVSGTGAALTVQDQPTATVTPASTTAPRGRIIDDSARGTILWEADSVVGAATKDSAGGSGRGGNSGGNSSVNSGGNSSENLAVGTNSGEDLPFSPLAGAGAAWGRPFSVEWESTRRVPFFRTRGLKNAWNAGREVKIARDGTEVKTRVGRTLIGLFGGREGRGGGEGVGT
ncbi:hypothetical protein ACLOAV_009908 [Pseudogymnoascus australis]